MQSGSVLPVQSIGSGRKPLAGMYSRFFAIIQPRKHNTQNDAESESVFPIKNRRTMHQQIVEKSHNKSTHKGQNKNSQKSNKDFFHNSLPFRLVFPDNDDKELY